MAYFRAHPDSGVSRPDQIAVVGDRLSTDIMMANMMGSYGFWVRDGVTGRGFVSASLLKDLFWHEFEGICLYKTMLIPSKFARLEDRLQAFLFKRGYSAPNPSQNHFE